MDAILGLDVGEFKSAACIYDPATTKARVTAIDNDPADLRKLLEATRPGTLIFESCPAAEPGWPTSSPTRWWRRGAGVGASDTHGKGAR